MVVESNLHRGHGIVRGDEFSIRRTITGIPSGAIITNAYLTIKDDLDDSDAQANVSKSITSSEVDGTGQVENSGSSGTGKVRFDLTEEDTLNLNANQEYWFDIQVKLDSGDIITLERGKTSVIEQVTKSS